MKRKIILSLITISVLSFASCGNSTTEEPETTVPVETTAEATPEPTATPKPTATPTTTPDAENTTTSEAQSKVEINENDSQTSEGEAIEDNVEQTTSTSDSLDDISSAKSYTLSEQEKADLRALGATEEQINNVKSGQDFIDLVYKLVNGGSSTAGGSSSSSTNTDSSDSFGDEVHDPSRVPQLHAGDGSLPGRM